MKFVVIIVTCTLFYGAGLSYLVFYVLIASPDSTTHSNAYYFTTNANWNPSLHGDLVGWQRRGTVLGYLQADVSADDFATITRQHFGNALKKNGFNKLSQPGSQGGWNCIRLPLAQ
eukprot:3667166-Pyramimonas_sp.AAC.1